MRFSIGAALLLCIVSPAPARAGDAAPALAYDAHSLTCVSRFDAVSAPAKLALLADKQAGQLIAQSGTLALDPSSSDSSGTAISPACEESPPPSATSAQTAIALSARMSAPRMPLLAGRVTSQFGMRVHPLLGGIRMHSGIDLAAPIGAPIFATDSGRVETAGWKGGYGLFVALQHANGLQTQYGHMSRLNVVAGQRVQKGEIIGFVGSTGRSTGAHLHYEVKYKGQAINPDALLLPRAVAPKSSTIAKAR